ncbi:MAG: nucleoside hydrolase [Firmicutes bacterium]|nr:nucleoside hydrolase [Bacillota bacterium]
MDTTWPVILDMDPGHDDALALLAALALLPVVGVSVVAGNQTVDKTFLNARRVLAMAGQSLPVARGYAKPLVRPLRTAAHVHGASGLDGYAFPPLPEDPAPLYAMSWLETVFSAQPHLNWIATGPLTNVAAFLLGHPHRRHQVRRLCIMGGALSGGNITPAAEFNFYVDPEAAAIVLASGLDIWLVGLDVTHRALLPASAIDRFRELRPPLGEMLWSLFQFFRHHEPHSRERGTPIHDVLAVMALVHPELFEWRETPLTVVTEGADRGALKPTDAGPPVHVAVNVDVDGALAWLDETLQRYRP